MRKCLLFVVVLILASCSDQFNVENVTDAVLEPSADSDVSALMEKARWGDGEAYVKLADCYRDGKGVKQDFINMLAMVSVWRIISRLFLRNLSTDLCLTQWRSSVEISRKKVLLWLRN